MAAPWTIRSSGMIMSSVTQVDADGRDARNEVEMIFLLLFSLYSNSPVQRKT